MISVVGTGWRKTRWQMRSFVTLTHTCFFAVGPFTPTAHWERICTRRKCNASGCRRRFGCIHETKSNLGTTDSNNAMAVCNANQLLSLSARLGLFVSFSSPPAVLRSSSLLSNMQILFFRPHANRKGPYPELVRREVLLQLRSCTPYIPCFPT